MEIVATGLYVPEGPAVLSDGSVLFTEQTAGRISHLDVSGNKEVFAFTGGSPNACAVGPRGYIYVCQNGGIVGEWRSPDPRTPSIQTIAPSGHVETLATHIEGTPLVAPNDLAFGPDGWLYFTDPAQPFNPATPQDAGAVYSVTPDLIDAREIIRVGGVYCNGIGFGAEKGLLWVESYTRNVCTLSGSGKRGVLCQLPEEHIPDGFAVAADGRIFIAACGSHAIDVLSPSGELLDSIYLDEDANPTNCCFDGSALIVTDFGMDFESVPDAGRLWRFETDAVGLPLPFSAEP